MDNSKVILSTLTQNDVSFIFNYAHKFGGALYVDNSKCSIIPKECFLSINGYTTEVLLLFLNNSAGSMGSTLYGGQLHECRLRFIADNNTVEFGRVTHYIEESDALVIFKTISGINEPQASLHNL